MVEINSWEPGINSPEETLYLRTLNEFRIEFENHVLFFIKYLRSLKNKKIESIYLKSELNYFNRLCKRYHIKKINLRINSEKDNPKLDHVLLLVKNLKKIIDYMYLDIADFYYENFDQFLSFKLNKNISIILKEILIKYNKKIPKKFEKVPREIDFVGVPFNSRYEESFKKNEQIEIFIEGIKNSIDKMYLKVYDYFVETNRKEINSQKTYFLLKDFANLGKKYSKLKFSVKIKNNFPKTSADKCLDEISSNLLRLKTLGKM